MSLFRKIGGMFSSASSRNEDPRSAEEAITMAQEQMAFGRYGDAERMLLSATGREPNRSDLKYELTQVYFIWGEADKFLALAKQIHAERATVVEWPLIATMGKQICPDEPLFF